MQLTNFQRFRSGLLSVFVLVVFTIVLTVYPILGMTAAATGAGSVLFIYVFYKPWHVFRAYLFLLPPHVLLMALLLTALGLPASVVKGISAWKEVTLLLLIASAILHTIKQRRLFLILPDLPIILYTMYVLAFLAILIVQRHSLSESLYGFRDVILPILLYFIGRGLSISDPFGQKIIQLILKCTLLFALLGILEWLFVPTQWHVIAGIPRYFRELLNTPYPDYLKGLPPNYWTSANSGLLRRAVSVYGSSQPFALSFLFFIPVCAYCVLDRRLAEYRFALLTLIISFIALTLTFTRFTIIVCVVQCLLAGLLGGQRAKRLIVRGFGLLGIASVLTIIVSSRVRLLAINTLTFRDDSSSSRLIVWGAALKAILQKPFGYGLGAVGQTAARFANDTTSIEGQYSKIGIELGLVGLTLYIMVLASISIYLLIAAYRLSTPYQRGLCFALSLTFIGLILNSTTTEWHNSIALVYPTWWLAGACVRLVAGHDKTKGTSE